MNLIQGRSADLLVLSMKVGTFRRAVRPTVGVQTIPASGAVECRATGRSVGSSPSSFPYRVRSRDLLRRRDGFAVASTTVGCGTSPCARLARLRSACTSRTFALSYPSPPITPDTTPHGHSASPSGSPAPTGQFRMECKEDLLVRSRLGSSITRQDQVSGTIQVLLLLENLVIRRQWHALARLQA